MKRPNNQIMNSGNQLITNSWHYCYQVSYIIHMSIAIYKFSNILQEHFILESVFTSDGLNFSQECWTCISSLTECRKFLTCD